ncbi:MAG: hypothetical protein DWH96_05425 [Planctomycetota bacterium]|nr:MAG: hypothetical protein DWH96_05425 [Planctomycetota bacterium]
MPPAQTPLLALQRCLEGGDFTRAVFTLSHEQVRRPINTTLIGRWKNYAFAFDGSWEGME